MKIYHNPRCRKSREALQLIKDKGHHPTVFEYLKEPLSEKELKEVVQLLGVKAHDLLRKGEQEFKDHVKGKDLSENEVINLMMTHPKLIERPIFINNKKAVVGRPPEKILEIL